MQPLQKLIVLYAGLWGACLKGHFQVWIIAGSLGVQARGGPERQGRPLLQPGRVLHWSKCWGTGSGSKRHSSCHSIIHAGICFPFCVYLLPNLRNAIKLITRSVASLQDEKSYYYYYTRKCCHICGAVKYGDGPPFDDFGPAAAHRDTLRSQDDFMSQYGEGHEPPLACIPGFHVSMLICDPMHALHLGICQWAAGSMLFILAWDFKQWGVFHGPQKTRLDGALRKAHAQFRKWCRARAIYTSQAVFSTNSIGKGEDFKAFPALAGKAANLRWVTMWLNDVLVKRGERTLEAALFSGLADMLYIMTEVPGPWLSQPQADRLFVAGRSALLAYGALAMLAKSRGHALWCVKPKHHQVDHLISAVKESRIHPGWAWAFADEDFNSRVMKLARHVKRRHLMSQRLLERYAIRMLLMVQNSKASGVIKMGVDSDSLDT